MVCGAGRQALRRKPVLIFDPQQAVPRGDSLFSHIRIPYGENL